MKLLHLGLTIDTCSSLSFKAHIKSICNKVNVKVIALTFVGEFVNSYLQKQWLIFTRPLSCHTLNIVLRFSVGLSSGLSNKLELTNQCTIRSLMNN